MKRIVSILLLLIYLPAVSGVSVDSFYCCGDLASIQFQLGTDKGASKTPNSSESPKVNLGCCNHVIHSFRIQDPQQQTSFKVSFNTPTLSAVLIPMYKEIQNAIAYKTITNTYLKSPPPLLGDIPLFIRDESFLI